MFGYVRPLKGELKVKEYEQYKAVYCALCHTLRKKYGLAASFTVNFDFTFLAMLLSDGAASPRFCRRRCIASPFKRKFCMEQTETLEFCAGRSVVLSYWKLKDAKSDKGFWKRLAASAGLLFLKKAYKKASASCPGYAETVKVKLAELNELEKENCPSLDKTADRFAQILRETADEQNESRARVLGELLYHLGRWIYIIDALDDYSEDFTSGDYNPIRFRFETESAELHEQVREYIRTTLEHSASLCAGALELLPRGVWSGILENIIYLGLPFVTQQVILGKWKDPGKKDI